MAMFLVFPFSAMFAAEVRMYPLAALFVFMTAIYAYGSLHTYFLRNWILCAIFGTCAAYTHYFALVSVGIIYGLLLLAAIFRKKELLKKWFLMIVLAVMLYLPWIKSFLEQLAYKVNHEYWIPPLTLYRLAGYIYRLFGSNAILVIFSCLCYVMTLVHVMQQKSKTEFLVALGALCVPVGTIVVGILVSIAIRPVFTIRYVVPAVPLLIFF